MYPDRFKLAKFLGDPEYPKNPVLTTYPYYITYYVRNNRCLTSDYYLDYYQLWVFRTASITMTPVKCDRTEGAFGESIADYSTYPALINVNRDQYYMTFLLFGTTIFSIDFDACST